MYIVRPKIWEDKQANSSAAISSAAQCEEIFVGIKNIWYNYIRKEESDSFFFSYYYSYYFLFSLLIFDRDTATFSEEQGIKNERVAI